jgi:glucosamine-6-phosphate deaminase
MTVCFPEYLNVPAEKLGHKSGVAVQRIPGGKEELGKHLALTMLGVIQNASANGNNATLIIPVGPVDQYPFLVQMINDQNIDCRHVCLINMDEYLDDNDRWIDADHPLSFRGFMQREFYDQLNPDLAPLAENRVFPHPDRCSGIEKIIAARGGVDVCFGGIGINGHIAFNEPPGASVSVEEFANYPTRCIDLACETRAINSNTVGGEISIIPRRAVTVGMRECLGSRQLRFYCNRLWQSAVVRRALHGPVTAECPASLLRTHRDAAITATVEVVELPEIKLR